MVEKTPRTFCEKQNRSIYNNNESTFNVSQKRIVKSGASHMWLGASIEQNHDGVGKTIAFATRFLKMAG